MLKGKQRAYLKSLANNLEVMSHIGKEGITDSVKASIEEALEKREILKIRILENSGLDTKDTANTLEQEINAEFVKAIGFKFTLYKKSKNNPKIKLPK